MPTLKSSEWSATLEDSARRMYEKAFNVYPSPPSPPKLPITTTLAFETLVLRLLKSDGRFLVKTFVEEWPDKNILHVAVLSKDKVIYRFEENPNTFPSDELIDKLRLLRE